MHRETVLLAIVLIAVGVYCILIDLELGIPDLEEFWPAILFVGGVALLVSFLLHKKRAPQLIFWGSALTLTSMLFSLIATGDQNYAVLVDWWPVVIIILGISFLALWLAQRPREPSVLFLAVVGIVSGAIAQAIHLGALGPTAAAEFGNLWPALIIAVGLVLLLMRSLPRDGA